MRIQRPYLPILVAALFLAAAAPARGADPHQTIRLTNYPGAAERVFTNVDASLFGTVGSFNSQRDLFFSAFRGDPFTQLQVTLVPPLGDPLRPGTYGNAGGVEAFPSRPVMQLLYFGPDGQFVCDGGSFTIHSLDETNPFQTLMDVSWEQACGGSRASGHAVFRMPPDVTAPFITISDSRVFALATMPEGAAVTYPLTVVDDRDPNPTVACMPPDGSVFTAGVEVPVACTATDASGNSRTLEFSVFVVGGEGQLLGLRDALALHESPLANLLVARANRALDAVVDGKSAIACDHLAKLEGELEERSSALVNHTELVGAAARIQAVFGC